MSNNKGSIEWIQYQIKQQGITHYFSLTEILEQAKAMRKEEMIEFAKLHVEAALKAASENARIKANTQQGGFMFTDDFEVVKESILAAYPLGQIK